MASSDQTKKRSYCWCFRNPANQLIQYVVTIIYPIIYHGLEHHPSWLALGFLNHLHSILSFCSAFLSIKSWRFVQVDLNFVSSPQGVVSPPSSSQVNRCFRAGDLFCCSPVEMSVFFLFGALWGCVPSSASHELNFEIQVTPMITWPFFQSLSINAKFLQLLDIATSNSW